MQKRIFLLNARSHSIRDVSIVVATKLTNTVVKVEMIITTVIIITDLTSNEIARSEFQYYSICELTKLHAYKLTDTIIIKRVVF